MTEVGKPNPTSDRAANAGSTSLQLLRRARGGDREALEQLFGRLVPSLHRWATGRLPRWARDGLDTDDIVQDAVANTLRRLHDFAPRRQRALQAYLRQAIRNRIRDELRRHERRAPMVRLDRMELTDPGSPMDDTVERDHMDRYQDGLSRLAEPDRELIVARLELGYSYAQMALATGRPSEDAARMALRRALVRLAEEMTSA